MKYSLLPSKGQNLILTLWVIISVGKKLENLKLDSLGNFKTNRVLDSKILKLQNLNSTRLASIFEFYHNSSIFEENSNYFDLWLAYFFQFQLFHSIAYILLKASLCPIKTISKFHFICWSLDWHSEKPWWIFSLG